QRRGYRGAVRCRGCVLFFAAVQENRRRVTDALPPPTGTTPHHVGGAGPGAISRPDGRSYKNMVPPHTCRSAGSGANRGRTAAPTSHVGNRGGIRATSRWAFCRVTANTG